MRLRERMIARRIVAALRRSAPLALAWLVLGAGVAAAQTSGRMRVNVLAADAPPIRRLDGCYRLEVSGGSDREGHAVWEIRLFAQRDTLGDNLLYHSQAWHGPYPTQISAWMVRKRLIPLIRTLPGYRGAPYVVTVRLRDMEVVGPDSAAAFRKGSFEVSWRLRSGRARPKACKNGGPPV